METKRTIQVSESTAKMLNVINQMNTLHNVDLEDAVSSFRERTNEDIETDALVQAYNKLLDEQWKVFAKMLYHDTFGGCE